MVPDGRSESSPLSTFSGDWARWAMRTVAMGMCVCVRGTRGCLEPGVPRRARGSRCVNSESTRGCTVTAWRRPASRTGFGPLRWHVRICSRRPSGWRPAVVPPQRAPSGHRQMPPRRALQPPPPAAAAAVTVKCFPLSSSESSSGGTSAAVQNDWTVQCSSRGTA
jgi:hypothetical protein